MDNRRLILFLVFCFSIFMLWDAWQKHNLPKPPVAAAEAATTNGQVPTPSAATNSNSAVPTGNGQALAAAPKVTVKTDLFQAEISTQGGDLIRLELEKHLAFKTNQAI